jgi:hypothetical protein
MKILSRIERAEKAGMAGQLRPVKHLEVFWVKMEKDDEQSV